MIAEPNTKTDFYYVDGEYIEYLKRTEEKSRGFTCVPNCIIGIQTNLCSELFY